MNHKKIMLLEIQNKLQIMERKKIVFISGGIAQHNLKVMQVNLQYKVPVIIHTVYVLFRRTPAISRHV